MNKSLTSIGSQFFSLLCVTLFLTANIKAQEDLSPFETHYRPGQTSPSSQKLDRLVQAELTQHGLGFAKQSSDAVFVRRIFLDMTGSLPRLKQVQHFLKNKNPQKRQNLIKRLFNQDAFADYWSMKWADVLRIKAEFPINLWPNAVQAYYQWLHSAIKTNMPYDQFARELLTSSGSNFRTPAVNFYRAISGKTPAAMASAVALTFMGSRTERWSPEQRLGFEQAFTRLTFKGTAEWKEEIITHNFNATEQLTITFPDGIIINVPVNTDPREVFTNWLVSKDNQWFATNAVNRIWFWLFGRGIIHQADDIRADNPPVNQALLGFLAQELIKSNYNLRHIYQLIFNSRTYQQSSIASENVFESEKYFAVYPVRRLDAEVLIDAINSITGMKEKYSSSIPEPFSFIPESESSIKLADGSISSPFLTLFGRPSRDTGLLLERDNSPNKSQALHMLNSSHIRAKITKSWKLKQLLKQSGRQQFKQGKKQNRKQTKRRNSLPLANIYMTILSRPPSKDELTAIKKYRQKSGLKTKELLEDLVWALINSKEFIYQH